MEREIPEPETNWSLIMETRDICPHGFDFTNGNEDVFCPDCCLRPGELDTTMKTVNPLLAYYDSFSGLIPVRITGYDADGHVSAIVTASRKGYQKGCEVSTLPNMIVSRRVRTVSGSYRVSTADHAAAKAALS